MKMKMTRLRLNRSKNSYGTIVKHINDPYLIKILATTAFRYLNSMYDTSIRQYDGRTLQN